MKTSLLSAATAALILFAGTGFAQQQGMGSGYYSGGTANCATPAITYGYGGYGGNGGYGGGTYEGSVLDGTANALTAAGQYNYNTALAMVQAENARSLYLDNYARAVRGRYDLKRVNAEYRAALNPLPNQQELIHVAEIIRPDRLAESQYSRSLGKLSWPAALLSPMFNEERVRLESAFALRTTHDAGIDSLFYRHVKELCDRMHDKMVANIDSLSTADSVSARKFLRSLEFEARLQPDVPALANAR